MSRKEVLKNGLIFREHTNVVTKILLAEFVRTIWTSDFVQSSVAVHFLFRAVRTFSAAVREVSSMTVAATERAVGLTNQSLVSNLLRSSNSHFFTYCSCILLIWVTKQPIYCFVMAK